MRKLSLESTHKRKIKKAFGAYSKSKSQPGFVKKKSPRVFSRGLGFKHRSMEDCVTCT